MFHRPVLMVWGAALFDAWVKLLRVRPKLYLHPVLPCLDRNRPEGVGAHPQAKGVETEVVPPITRAAPSWRAAALLPEFACASAFHHLTIKRPVYRRLRTQLGTDPNVWQLHYTCDGRPNLGAGCRLREAAAHAHVSSILSTMRCSVSFSRAAATLSLSPSCLVT